MFAGIPLKIMQNLTFNRYIPPTLLVFLHTVSICMTMNIVGLVTNRISISGHQVVLHQRKTCSPTGKGFSTLLSFGDGRCEI